MSQFDLTPDQLQIQEMAAKLVIPGVSIVDELIAERRAEGSDPAARNSACADARRVA